MKPPAKRLASGLAIAAVLVGSVLAGRRGIASMQAGEGRIRIVEYSDYQCPACRHAQPALKKLLDYYGDKVEFVHKHYPLPMHKWANAASYAAVCAEKQGKAEAFSGLLFDRQDAWSKDEHPPSLFRDYAKELGLDLDAFDACVGSAATFSRVQTDVEEGRRLRVSSTPTYFIGAERLAGGRQLSHRGGQLIEKLLKERE